MIFTHHNILKTKPTIFIGLLTRNYRTFCHNILRLFGGKYDDKKITSKKQPLFILLKMCTTHVLFIQR